MTYSEEKPVERSKSAANINPSDPETVFNKILDSICEVYFSMQGEKNSQKLFETILQLKQLKKAINFSH